MQKEVQFTTLGKRQGFVTMQYGRLHYSRLANLARKLRLSGSSSGKPTMSQILKNCKMTQTTESFATEDGVCALGAIARTLDVEMQDGVKLNWKQLIERCDASIAELNRQVHCPKCNELDSITATITHMNDRHQSTFKDIGIFLEKWNL